jgi:hypothetical protein
VDTGGHVRGAAAQPEPGDGEAVRRDGVLVRIIIFSTSRMVYGLAEEGHAPGFFRRLSRAAVPARGLLFSCICLLLGAGYAVRKATAPRT